MFLSSEQARSSIDCAHQCLHYQQLGGVCNAYSFSNVSLLCELASLTFLEDPLPDQSDGGEKKVMVAAAVLHTASTQYLHSICTVSAQYLHSIYTVSTLQIPSIPRHRRTCPGASIPTNIPASASSQFCKAQQNINLIKMCEVDVDVCR